MDEQPHNPGPMTVTRTERDGSVIVRMVGELDMTTVNLASTALDEVAGPRRTVVIDLTEIRFFASAGLNLLLQLHKDAVQRQMDVRLATEQRAVLRPLALMGLADLFPIHASVDEAILAATRSDSAS
jgi:anti-sigma B factor antagonist